MSNVGILCWKDDKVQCNNCEWTGLGYELDLIADFEERVEADCPCPAGQCPECGALAYLVDDEGRN